MLGRYMVLLTAGRQFRAAPAGGYLMKNDRVYE